MRVMGWCLVMVLCGMALSAGCNPAPVVQEQSPSDAGNKRDGPATAFCGNAICPAGGFCCQPGLRWSADCKVDTCIYPPKLPPTTPDQQCVGHGRCDTDADCESVWDTCQVDPNCEQIKPGLEKKGYCWRPGCYSDRDCDGGKTCKDRLCR